MHIPSELLEVVDYDPNSGNLTWKDRPRSHFTTDGAWRSTNSRDSGAIAGCKQFKKNGDPIGAVVKFNGQLYLAHRIVWSKSIGVIGEGVFIDHRDGNPFNNRLDNLREASRSQNGMNRRVNRNNASGYKGVSWSKRIGKWKAAITVSKKDIHLGYFQSRWGAYAAYREASSVHHGEFATFRA